MSGTTEETFYVFTNLGRCYCVNYDKFIQKGEGNIREFLNFSEDEEEIATYNPSTKCNEVFVATKLGMIKKLEIEEILSIKKSKAFITLQEYDKVIDVLFGTGNEKVAMASQVGNIVLFDGAIINTSKLPSKGIIGMKLKELTDEVVSAALVTNNDNFICTITTAGYAKKTELEEYPVTTRGTKGRLACKLNNDELIEIKPVSNSDTVLNSKVFGQIPVESIPTAGRTSHGTDLLKM